MTINRVLRQVFKSDAWSDFIDECIAKTHAELYESIDPRKAVTHDEYVEMILDREAARRMHNYFTTPDRHIHD